MTLISVPIKEALTFDSPKSRCSSLLFLAYVKTCQINWSSTGFHSSEVPFNYDCSLKWSGLFLGHQVHGLLPCAGKPRQEVQILPLHRLHLHLLLGHQGGQGDLACKEKEESIYSQEECQAQAGDFEEEIRTCADWNGIQPETYWEGWCIPV